MSTELSLFLLALLWIGLAYGLGYFHGVRSEIRRVRQAAGEIRPFDQERDA